jgi:type IV pilus assembly protein PilF
MKRFQRLSMVFLSGLTLSACHGTPTVNPAVGTESGPSSSNHAAPTQSQRAAAARANMTLGLGYLQQGNLPIAKEKLDKARSEDPTLPDLHGAMALLDQRLGKDKEADKEFREALKIDSHDPAMLNNYAVFLCSHGKPDPGVRYFEEAAANPLYTTPWAAYTNAGVCLRAAHRDAEAGPRFDRALQSNPAYAEAVFQAADLNLQQQKYADARFRIDLYLLRNPGTPDLLLLGWRVAQAQHDTEAQQKFAARLAQEFPNSEQSRALTAPKPNPG